MPPFPSSSACSGPAAGSAASRSRARAGRQGTSSASGSTASSRSRVASFLVLENDNDYKRLNLQAERGKTVPGDLGVFVEKVWTQAGQVLSPRERQVLRMRYGLAGGREHTLGEIADQLGVTSERVRQIESAALSKLRQPKLRHKLRESELRAEQCRLIVERRGRVAWPP